MGSRIGDSLVSNLFNAVPYSKELAEEKEKVARLELRQGVLEILVERVEPNPDQPRKTFSDESITLLARSLERDGQQQPISVFMRGKGKYFLFDGERRWRAVKELGWETVQAIVIADPKSPDQLHRQALRANHHRENMNPLDLAEALVKEVASTGEVNEETVPKLLNTAVKRLIRNKNLEKLTEMVSANQEEQEQGLLLLEESSEITSEESHVLRSLLSLQLNPHSVNTNVIPSLRLFEDLKEKVRREGLGVHQAFALQRLSPKNLGKTEKQSQTLRQRVTKEVIAEKLSVTATRKRVGEELARHKDSEEPTLSQVARTVLAGIEKLNPGEMERDDLKALEASLKQKLKEVRAALKD